MHQYLWKPVIQNQNMSVKICNRMHRSQKDLYISLMYPWQIILTLSNICNCWSTAGQEVPASSGPLIQQSMEIHNYTYLPQFPSNPTHTLSDVSICSCKLSKLYIYIDRGVYFLYTYNSLNLIWFDINDSVLKNSNKKNKKTVHWYTSSSIL